MTTFSIGNCDDDDLSAVASQGGEYPAAAEDLVVGMRRYHHDSRASRHQLQRRHRG
jgi:hypothetical protein